MTPRVHLVLASLAGMALLVPTLRWIRRAAPGLIVPVWFAASFGIQLVPLFLIAAFDLPTTAVSSTYAPDLAEHSVLTVASILLVPLATLGSLRLARWLGLLSPELHWRTRDVRLSAAARVMLGGGGLVTLLFWPATLPSAGFLGYAVRIVHTALLMTPFLAGRYGRGRPRLDVFWIAVLAANLLVGIVLGGRFVALLPILLFALGRLSVIAPAARRRVLRVAAIALVPAILFIGAVEAIRNQIGRGGLELLTGERVQAVAREVEGISVDLTQFWRQALTFGLYRLINVPGVVVPILSPDDVPYRNPGSLVDEIASYARISALSGQSRQDYLDAGLGTAAANAYGFTVNEFTSVQFGLVADAWSRGGGAVAVAVTAAMVLLLLLLEQGIVHLFVGDRSLQLLFVLVLVKSAIVDVPSIPVIAGIRQIMLDLFVVAVVFAGVQLLPRRTRVVPA